MSVVNIKMLSHKNVEGGGGTKSSRWGKCLYVTLHSVAPTEN